MRKKPVSKIIAFVTAVFTMVVMCGLPAVAFAWDGGVTKEETVYVVTDSTGAQSDVIVSDHLVNKGETKTIEDETTLTDIENVKGEETFRHNGDNLTWDAEGNSIYYQGKTTDEVPVTMDVVYRLDDKVVSGPELQGKSGKVEITINYENAAEYEGTTVPFIVMTGLIVTDESFKNIKITKGKVIDDGEKLLVVGMAAPGLAQTLGIGESELGIGSSVTITGDAEAFAVEDMMTIVTNAFFEDIDSDGIDLDYDDQIKQLDKGAKALVEGSDALYKGLNNMDSQMPDLVKGATALDNGAKALGGSLFSQMESIIEGTELLKSGAFKVLNGLQDTKTKLDEQVIPSLEMISGGLSNASSSLTENHIPQAASDVAHYLNTLNKAKGKINAHKDAIKAALMSGEDGLSEDEANLLLNNIGTVSTEASGVSYAVNGDGEEGSSLPEKIEGAADGISQVTGKPSTETTPGSGLHLLSESLGSTTNQKTLIGGTAEIYAGLDELNSQLSETTAGDGELSQGLSALTAGTNQLKNGTEKLRNGVSMVDAGSLKLSQGMSKLYKEGIRKIVDMYNDDLKGTLNSVDGMLNAGRGYKTFTKLPSGMDGNVKFIYKTDMTQ